MAVTFPALVYKGGGPYLAPGGYYDYKQVADQTAYDAALAAGWKASLSEVVTNPYGMLPDPTKTAPGTILSQDGVAYICDGVNWDALSIKDYTATTLPDPATLAPGAVVMVDGKSVQADSNGKLTGAWAKRKTNVAGRGWMATSGNTGFTATGAAYTFLNEIEFDVEFDWVRFHLVNGNTSTLTTIASKVASASAIGNDGTGLTWAAASFSDAGNVQPIPPATAATPLTYAVPAVDVTVGANTTPQAVNNGVWSDWIKIPSVARSDGKAGSILHIRNALPINAYVASIGSAQVISANASAGDLHWYQNIGAGDLVTTIAALTGSTQGWGCVDAVEIIPRQVSVSHILEVGDSISRGQGWIDQNGGVIAPGFLAALSLYGKGVSYTNKAVSGRKQAAYIAEAKKMITSGFYSAVIIPVWTPNDNDSTDTIGQDWASLLAFVNFAKSKGVKVGLRSAIPDYALYLAADNTRKSLNAKAKALAASDANVFYIDTDSIISDGASPARQLSVYSVGNDGRHPNAAGITASALAYKFFMSCDL